MRTCYYVSVILRRKSDPDSFVGIFVLLEAQRDVMATINFEYLVPSATGTLLLQKEPQSLL